MNSTWTGAPGCVNDALLTGLEFVDGFQSYFFVKRWTMHQLVNSFSQLSTSVSIFELNIGFQKFWSWHHCKGTGFSKEWVGWWLSFESFGARGYELHMGQNHRMAVRGAAVVFCCGACNGEDHYPCIHFTLTLGTSLYNYLL